MENQTSEIAEVKANAERMIGNMSIKNSEPEIMEILAKITQTDGVNLSYDKKILECIGGYLTAKEKINVAEEDLKYLHNVAEGLREQEIRITDSISTPLFKIVNKYGDEKYFITRENAEKYIEMDRLGCRNKYNKIMEIVSNENMELERLLEIIKRNF